MTQFWQCRVCHSTAVRDQMLVELEGSLQIHRLTCEHCGAVGHYDDRTRADHPTTTVNERFWYLEEPWHPRGAGPITTSPHQGGTDGNRR